MVAPPAAGEAEREAARREIDSLGREIDELEERIDARIRFAKLLDAAVENMRRKAPEVYAKAMAWHRRRGRRD